MMNKYAPIIDVAVQHSPEITALVWASARFILQVATIRADTIENVRSAADTIVTRMTMSEFCSKMYENVAETALNSSTTTQHFAEYLDSALPEFYASVLVFSIKARMFFDPSMDSEQFV